MEQTARRAVPLGSALFPPLSFGVGDERADGSHGGPGPCDPNPMPVHGVVL